MAPSAFSSEPWFPGCGHTDVACKVVKGQLVEVGKWPWQVSILLLGVHICSGSLVHHQWVLTAAHCFQRSVRVARRSQGLGSLTWGALETLGFLGDLAGWSCAQPVSLPSLTASLPASSPRPCRSADPKNYSVMVGVQHLPENGTQLPLTRVVIHEDFDNLISQDIALLKLRDPVSWSRLVQPVCLPNTEVTPSVGTVCWVTGWGRPKSPGERRPALCKTPASSEPSPRAPPFVALCPCSRRQLTLPGLCGWEDPHSALGEKTPLACVGLR